jgi:hypothetical protein
MVPRLAMRSFLVIPIPESQMVRVLLVLSGMILMKSFSSFLRHEGSVIDRYLILSRASEAFEINSLRKTSLFE